jgi:3'(2'), 5'-bisphosphate nucleotidase|tara:strand:+ start:143 stop:904 length:762 start_codon:yes stop_codon:yes gene_type:complete
MANPEDHIVAARIATEAGNHLVELRERLFASGADTWTVKDTGDMEAHNFIIQELTKVFPDDGILSEEGADDLTRLEKDRVWIVDPLDGTREYGEPGRSDWAVHIALAERGVPTAGAVALPAIGQTLSTHPAPPMPPRVDGPPRLVVSRSRAPAAAMIVAEATGAQMLSLGSAGAKAMAVVLGHADIYAHSGGQYEWDNCAPAAVALAAGFHASRCDGSPLEYNFEDPWSPDLIICRPELADEVVAAIRKAIEA